MPLAQHAAPVSSALVNPEKARRGEDASMPRSRRSVWMRDELVLALDLYRRVGRNPSQQTLAEVQALLHAFPVEAHLAGDPSFRTISSVNLKVANFVAIDPQSGIAGMSRGGARDTEVWEEFSGDWTRLSATAEAIRTNLDAVTSAEAEQEDRDVADAPEGRLLTRVHVVRERSQRLVDAKKAAALAAHESLSCEVCGFDFAAAYGERGEGFAECHHKVPVSKLRKGSRTRLSDLALVCSNCHRMIHRRAPWLTIEQLQALVVKHGAKVTPRRLP
jgi:5-methylcytosine-specific restriction enzyme A